VNDVRSGGRIDGDGGDVGRHVEVDVAGRMKTQRRVRGKSLS